MDEKIEIQMDLMKIAEMVTFGERLLAIVDKAEIDEIKTNEFVVELRALVGECKTALSKNRTSGLGSNIAEADALRDRLYNALKRALEGMVPFGGDKAAAATHLLGYFKKHGSITKLNYSEQTQVLDAVIADLFSSQGQAMLEIVGFTDQAELLKDSQAAFWKLYDERQDIESDLDRLPAASSLKRALIALIRDFFSLLWVMRKRQGWKEIYLDVLRETKTEKYSGRI